MLLRWLNKQRFDASRPANGRLPAKSRISICLVNQNDSEISNRAWVQ